eukprot:CAMPEP_0201530434 /NCGR_PEP_ID=MMETSP0161_2-20130828/44650_1 /ASSEMBLY_ACC=CAM_ASM_000251 /TAXON_ID=180227 /ORGANISM="Neoparamoeba aestuarina, Strain SoJaBio B1-5/56/2" /LENGTH=80 /DNA_ID=CAMNT_0047932787 /DNA_START=179 /DNA_END=421 /DNA_ORIENTATION=+
MNQMKMDQRERRKKKNSAQIPVWYKEECDMERENNEKTGIREIACEGNKNRGGFDGMMDSMCVMIQPGNVVLCIVDTPHK